MYKLNFITAIFIMFFLSLYALSVVASPIDAQQRTNQTNNIEIKFKELDLKIENKILEVNKDISSTKDKLNDEFNSKIEKVNNKIEDRTSFYNFSNIVKFIISFLALLVSFIVIIGYINEKIVLKNVWDKLKNEKKVKQILTNVGQELIKEIFEKRKVIAVNEFDSNLDKIIQEKAIKAKEMIEKEIKLKEASLKDVFNILTKEYEEKYVAYVEKYTNPQEYGKPLKKDTDDFLLKLNEIIRDIFKNKFDEPFYELLVKGVDAIKEHNYNNGIILLSNAIALIKDNKNSDNYFAYFFRGIGYLKTNQYKMAEKDFNEAILINKKLPQGYNERGFVYLKQKDIDKSITDFKTALKIDPKYCLVYLYLIESYIVKGQFSDALENIEAAIKINKNIEYAIVLNFYKYVVFLLLNKNTNELFNIFNKLESDKSIIMEWDFGAINYWLKEVNISADKKNMIMKIMRFIDKK